MQHEQNYSVITVAVFKNIKTYMRCHSPVKILNDVEKLFIC